MHRKIWISLALTAFVIAGFTAAALPGSEAGSETCADCPLAKHDGAKHHGRHSMSGPMGDHFAERLAERLDLSADQQAQWQTLREEHHAAIEPLVEQMRAQKEQIHQQLESGSAEAAALGQLMIDSHKLGEQIRGAHEATHGSFRELLTSEQQQTLDELHATHGERGKRSHDGNERHGHRGHRGASGSGVGL